MTTRQLTPYEHTHLARYGAKKVDLTALGEIPVEYVTSKVEFFGRVFGVSPDVLIPRIETEELIKLAVKESHSLYSRLPTPRPLVIADVGTGCGAIGITLYLELASLGVPTRIYLSEVSAPALAVATSNIATLTPGAPLTALHSDLLTNFPPDIKYDLMVANLPYIPTSRIDYLDDSVKKFEPHLALDGGPEGLTLIQKFLQQAPAHLAPAGKIILEIDHTHTRHELLALTTKTQLNVKIETTEDSFGQQRFAVIEVAHL